MEIKPLRQWFVPGVLILLNRAFWNSLMSSALARRRIHGPLLEDGAKPRERLSQLQLQLEIATLPSYISSVDLDPFGQLSVFLIECRAQLFAPIKI